MADSSEVDIPPGYHRFSFVKTQESDTKPWTLYFSSLSSPLHRKVKPRLASPFSSASLLRTQRNQEMHGEELPRFSGYFRAVFQPTPATAEETKGAINFRDSSYPSSNGCGLASINLEIWNKQRI
ncbi:uncharacterized protein LOC125468418 [Pyrus x bretschneideri]|uniref:uncharacterized protein LOC125468418 n=1 Tax=Pyrus x bretschneideri TaxID=225117 RepID=UPI002030C70E|nr:uncharacterized protein LOC125468418 [Pyrus x bretschneideri]